jgi:hypothetical protein
MTKKATAGGHTQSLELGRRHVTGIMPLLPPEVTQRCVGAGGRRRGRTTLPFKGTFHLWRSGEVAADCRLPQHSSSCNNIIYQPANLPCSEFAHWLTLPCHGARLHTIVVSSSILPFIIEIISKSMCAWQTSQLIQQGTTILLM